MRLQVILTLSVSPGILVLIKSHLFFKPIWASSHKFNPLYYVNFLTSNSLFPLGVFFVFGIIQTITHENKVGFYTFILIAVPLLILTFIPTKVRSDRYIFNILPLIILLASYSINNVFKSELGKITDLLSKYNLIRYNIITSCLILLLVLMFTFTHGFIIVTESCLITTARKITWDLDIVTGDKLAIILQSYQNLTMC